MNTIVIIIVVLLVAGIIALNWPKTPKKKTREEYLKELTEFIEGTITPIDKKPDSFRIEFVFEGQPFIFEDIKQASFGEGNFKAFLRTQANSHLTLYFTERHEKTTIRTNIVMASEIKGDPDKQKVRVKPPEELESFKIHTNDPITTNRVFEDAKAARLITSFKNVDARGYQFMPLKMQNGNVSLEFQSSGNFKPNLRALKNDPPTIEDFLKKIIAIIRKVEMAGRN